MSLLPALLLVPAGVLAGVIGSAGGITSLVSYPALLAAGVPPLPANVGNIVAAVALGPSSALASRDELTGRRSVLLRLLPLALISSAAGALLLLVTPPGVFERIVPFLVAAGALVLLLQPTLVARHDGGELGVGALALVVTPVSVYSGYFGAGSGVMFLAAVLFYEARVPPANAIKNVLVGVTCAAAALILVFTASVPWSAVVPLALGLLLGGALGPRVVRRIPGRVVRWCAAALGFGLAIYLWFAAA